MQRNVLNDLAKAKRRWREKNAQGGLCYRSQFTRRLGAAKHPDIFEHESGGQGTPVVADSCIHRLQPLADLEVVSL